MADWRAQRTMLKQKLFSVFGWIVAERTGAGVEDTMKIM